MESDRYYEGIAAAVPDGAGGIFFTHVVTPLPWPQGSIMWLPAGAERPDVAVELEDPTGQSLQPLQGLSGTDGQPRLLYQRQTFGEEAFGEVWSLDLSTGSTQLLVGSISNLTSTSTDGERLLLVRSDGECSWFELLSLEGDPLEGLPNPRPAGTCQGGIVSAVALSPRSGARRKLLHCHHRGRLGDRAGRTGDDRAGLAIQ